jgi:hypothetical protein
LARDPILNENILWRGRPHVVEAPALFRTGAVVLFLTAAASTSFAFVAAWGAQASPAPLLLFAVWVTSLGFACLHLPRIWYSKLEYIITDHHVVSKRGPFRRVIPRKSISYARIFWLPGDPNVGDIELVRAVPTGAMRRRLLIRLIGLAAPDKVWALIRGVDSKSESNAGDRCVSQRLEEGERVLWSASPRTSWRRFLPHGRAAWQNFALGATLVVTVAHMALRLVDNWHLLLDAGLADQMGTLVALAAGQAISVVLLVSVTGFLLHRSVVQPGRQLSKTRYLITNRRVLIQREHEELHLDRDQIVDVIDIQGLRGLHNVFLVLDGPRARALELSGAFGESERDSNLRPILEGVEDWESVSTLLLRTQPSLPPPQRVIVAA